MARGTTPAGLAFAIAALAGLGVVGATGCDKVLGIKSIHVDESATGGGGAAATGTGGAACSPAAAACAACLPCGEVVDVVFDDFGAPTSPALPLTGATSGESRSTVPKGVECREAMGPERIYAVHAGQDGYLTAKLSRADTAFDSVLYVRKGCCSPDVVGANCADSRKSDDDHALHGGEVLSFRVAKGEVYYLFVDGTQGESGAYSLDLNLARGVQCAGSSWVPIDIDEGSPMTLSGNTTALGNTGQNRCFLDHPAGAGDLGEIVYELRAPSTVKSFDLALNGTFDTVLYARSDCVDSNAGSMGELACEDKSQAAGGEFITGLPNGGSPVYVFVDTGPLAAESYEYTLIVTPK